jgi:hypothetical protein
MAPARLAEELAPLHADGAAAVARHVVALAEQRAPDRLRDDLAVLVLRTAPDAAG